MKKACVDMDGVTLDFLGALSKVLLKDGIDFDQSSVVTYNFSTLPKDLRKRIYDEINHFRLYHEESFFPDVIDAISLLKEHCHVEAFTKVPPNPMILTCRNNQIESLGISGKACVSKKVLPTDADVVFEVCAEKLLSLEGYDNTIMYLIDYPYNQQSNIDSSNPLWKRIIRVSSFYEAVKDYISSLTEK